MNKSVNSDYINTTLGALVSPEKKSIISGPFGSNVGKIFFQKEGIPLIRGNNLSTGSEKFKDSGFVFLTREKANELNCYAIKNDIIFTAVGTIGQVGIIEERLSFEEYVISNKQLRVRFDTLKINPLFAYYWFSSPWIQKIILQQNVGSTVPLINLRVLKGLPIRMPKSIETQKQIVGVLEIISSKIELNNRINTELGAMAKTLYDYWFVQFDFPDDNGNPYKTSGGKFIYNEELKREIPDGWEVKKIMDLVPILTGKKDANFANPQGKYPFFTCAENISYCDEYAFNGKSVLLSGNGNFNIKMYEGKFNAYQRTYVLIPEDEKNYTIVYFSVKNRIKSLTNGSRGSIVKFITKGDIENITVVLPKSGFSNLFTELNTITKQIELRVEENLKLSEIRDWLLPMLMNGQVKIGEAPKQILNVAAEPEQRYKKG